MSGEGRGQDHTAATGFNETKLLATRVSFWADNDGETPD